MYSIIWLDAIHYKILKNAAAIHVIYNISVFTCESKNRSFGHIHIRGRQLCNLVLRISRTEWIESYPWEAHYICFIFNAFSFLFLTQETKGCDTPRLQYLLPFQYDVGVDNNDDKPISFLRLKEIMDTRYYSEPEDKETESLPLE